MNKLIPLLAFSVLLLVPVGAQNAFAGFSCGIPNIPNGDGSSCDGTFGDNSCNTWTCNTGFTKAGTDPQCDPGSIYSGTFTCEAGVIGGEIIPIDATSLILAGAQTFSWMIPVVLSVLGIGLFVVSRKSENLNSSSKT